MEFWADLRSLLSAIFLIGGSSVVLISAFGLLRLPDFLSRSHAASVLDTAATALILLGLVLQVSEPMTAIKLLLILLFSMLGAPTAVHALARAVVHLAHSRRYGLNKGAGGDPQGDGPQGDDPQGDDPDPAATEDGRGK